MKNKWMIWAAVAFLSTAVLVSCSKESSGPGGGGDEVTGITINADKSSIINDGVDKISFSVKANTGIDLTSQCTFYNGTTELSGSTFTSTATGTYPITVKYKELSAGFSVTVANALTFTRKVLAEDFTGAWCGWCPLMAYNLDSIAAANNRLIFVAVHDGQKTNPSGGGYDPFVTTWAPPLEGQVPGGFAGFPTGLINRYTVTDQFNVGNSAKLALSKPAEAGLQISTMLTGSSLTATIKCGFRKDVTAQKIKLAVMLVEDKLKEPQVNYYDGSSYVPPSNPLYSAGHVISDWEHNGVLRTYATDVTGEEIPSNNTTAGNVSFEKSYNFSLTGFKPENCRVVAVLILSTTTANTQVMNAQSVKAGESQLFD